MCFCSNTWFIASFGSRLLKKNTSCCCTGFTALWSKNKGRIKLIFLDMHKINEWLFPVPWHVSPTDLLNPWTFLVSSLQERKGLQSSVESQDDVIWSLWMREFCFFSPRVGSSKCGAPGSNVLLFENWLIKTDKLIPRFKCLFCWLAQKWRI